MKTELTEDFTGCLAFLEGVAVLATPFFYTHAKFLVEISVDSLHTVRGIFN